MSRSISKDNKLYKNCPYFMNTKCDCKEGECKTREVFREETAKVEDLETPLKKFFQYMKENNYWIGNDLVDKYRDLLEEEKKFISRLRKK